MLEKLNWRLKVGSTLTHSCKQCIKTCLSAGW